MDRTSKKRWAKKNEEKKTSHKKERKIRTNKKDKKKKKNYILKKIKNIVKNVPQTLAFFSSSPFLLPVPQMPTPPSSPPFPNNMGR